MGVVLHSAATGTLTHAHMLTGREESHIMDTHTRHLGVPQSAYLIMSTVLLVGMTLYHTHTPPKKDSLEEGAK